MILNRSSDSAAVAANSAAAVANGAAAVANGAAVVANSAAVVADHAAAVTGHAAAGRGLLVAAAIALLPLWAPSLAAAAPHPGSAAAPGRPLFRPARRDFVAGGLMRELVEIDFNEDGRPDIAGVRFSFGAGRIELLQGDGTGEFKQAGSFPTAGGSTSIAAGDFDEDGHTDLVTAGFLADALFLHLGDGDGAFDPVPLPFGGQDPFQVIAAYIDGDEHLDLAVTGSGSQAVHVLAGDGRGGFAAAGVLPAGETPRRVATGDVNQDGAQDLVAVDPGGNQLFVYLGDGHGGFGAPLVLEPGNAPGSVDIETLAPLAAAASLVAVTLSGDNQVRVFEWNDDTATLDPVATLAAGVAPEMVRFTRPDAGGPLGLAVVAQSSDELLLYDRIDRTDGSDHDPAAAEPRRFELQLSPTSLWVADWSGDGHPDFMAPGFLVESLSLYLGDGAGSVHNAPSVAVPGAAASLRAVNWNGDRLPDLAVLRVVDRQVSVLRAVAPVTYELVDVGEQLPQVPGGFAVLDVDEDGAPDFATALATGSTLWLLESASGYARSEYPLGGIGPTAVVAEDLDHNGDVDLAVTLFLSSMVAVLWNDGAGGFELPLLTPVGTGPQNLVAGDWNGDGRDDLATVDAEGSSVTILIQDDQRRFPASPPLPVGVGSARGVAAARLVGDQHLDLVVTGSAGVEVLAGDGAGGFGTVQSFATAAEYEGVRIADVNDDGFEDVIAADRIGNGVAVYPGWVPGLTVPHAFGTAAGPTDLEVVDLDDNGTLDLAVLARLGGRVSFLLSPLAGAPDGLAGAAPPAAGVASGAPGSRSGTARVTVLPNPFRTHSNLDLRVDGGAGARATVRIYDVGGRLIAAPFAGRLGGGRRLITWDGRDLGGRPVPRGVYFYRVDVRPAASAAGASPPRMLRGRLVRR